MCIAVSLVIATFYGMFILGYVGSSHEKYCLANQIDYHPFVYKDQEQMMDFLKQTGS